MGFLSGLALILLTLVGYSSGTVLAGKGKQVIPGLLDLGVVIALWAGALATRPALGKALAILVWLIGGLAVGTGLTALRRRKYPNRKPKALAKTLHVNGLKHWWMVWKAFATEMGNFQGRMLLALFYFFIVTPFGIMLRLFGDPLRLRRNDGSTFWVKQLPVTQTLKKARDQF